MKLVTLYSERLAEAHRGALPKEEAWFDKELFDCQFKDACLGKRFQTLLEQLSNGVGESIPLVRLD